MAQVWLTRLIISARKYAVEEMCCIFLSIFLAFPTSNFIVGGFPEQASKTSTAKQHFVTPGECTQRNLQAAPIFSAVFYCFFAYCVALSTHRSAWRGRFALLC